MEPNSELNWKIEGATGFSYPCLEFSKLGIIPKGRLIIEVKAVKKLYKSIGKSDPIIDLFIADQKHRVSLDGKLAQRDASILLEGAEDCLTLDVWERGAMGDEELIGSTRLPLTELLHVVHPALGHPRDGHKGPSKMSSEARTDVKDITDKIQASKLDDILKAQLLMLLNATKAKNPSHEAWFSFGRGECLVNPAGKVRLQMQFIPDYSSPPRQFAPLTPLPLGLSGEHITQSAASKIGSKFMAFASKVGEASTKLGHKVKTGVEAGVAAAKTKISEMKSEDEASPPTTSVSAPALLMRPKRGRFFATALKAACFASPTQIPLPCSETIEYIEQNGLKAEGIFRVPGNNVQIQHLRQAYESGSSVQLDDVHDAAGVLKLYLREMAEPLVPYVFYKRFLGVEDVKFSATEKATKYAQLVSELPSENRELLGFLTQFLAKIAEHSEVNLMASKNIAIVFAPNILRPDIENATSVMMEMPVQIACMQTIIDQHKTIFPEPIVLKPKPTASDGSTSDLDSPTTPLSGGSGSGTIPPPPRPKPTGPPPTGPPPTAPSTSSKPTSLTTSLPHSTSAPVHPSPTAHPAPPPIPRGRPTIWNSDSAGLTQSQSFSPTKSTSPPPLAPPLAPPIPPHPPKKASISSGSSSSSNSLTAPSSSSSTSTSTPGSGSGLVLSASSIAFGRPTTQRQPSVKSLSAKFA